MRVYVKFSSFLVIGFTDKLDVKNNILKYSWRNFSLAHFPISSEKISEFDHGSSNTILFQIKVFGINIKESILAMYSIRMIVCSKINGTR